MVQDKTVAKNLGRQNKVHKYIMMMGAKVQSRESTIAFLTGSR